MIKNIYTNRRIPIYNFGMTDTGADDLIEAERLLQDGNLEEARGRLARHVQNNPSSERGGWLLGFALTETRQQIECMERILRINPYNAIAQNRLETLKEVKGENAQASDVQISKPVSVKVPPADRANANPSTSRRPTQSPTHLKTRPLKRAIKKSWPVIFLIVLACVVLVALCASLAFLF